MKKTENRSAIKSQWNNHGFALAPKVAPPKTSWWTAAAAPDAREQFSTLAKTRNAEHSWTNAAPHAMNPRNEVS